MKIAGTVKDIIYRNDENGYSILRMADGGVAVGVFAGAFVGAEFEMEGEYVQNSKYGKQFKMQTYNILPPDTTAKIQQFIGSGLISGIGAKMAERIVLKFGADTLAVMEYRADELAQVRGISAKKAIQIHERFAEVKEMQKAVSFLTRFDVTLNLAIKIWNKYKGDTISAVQENPYKLVQTIDGVGFLTADKMAGALGISYSGHFRVRAGIIHVLKQSADGDGHTALPETMLFDGALRLLKIRTETLRPVFDDVLNDLCLDKFVTRVTIEGVAVYALTKYFSAEKLIAEKLKQLCSLDGGCDPQRVGFSAPALISSAIAQYEKLNNIKLHDVQKTAVESGVTNGVTVITGGPGTGKTTIIRAILYINQTNRLSTQLLAPTGRAAKRLEETCGIPASTIHRALDIDYKDGRGHFTYDDPENVLRADVIIVDEVSMCDSILMSLLLKKVLPTSRVILVGDIDQLASVGAGAVLGDVIASGVVPTVRLTQIYRQDEKSKIVTNAHAINRGEMPDISNKCRDFFFEATASPTETKAKVIALVTERLPKYFARQVRPAAGMVDCMNTPNVQVLCPLKAGDAGMTALNVALQNAINPHTPDKPEYTYGENVYRVDDRVMQTQNDYALKWTREGAEDGEGVYNGDMGVVVAVNPKDGAVTVRFEDGRVAEYVRADLASLVPSYAITVHKSQGCEFDVAVIPVTSGAFMILTRNLLYTAVTRAKKMVVLVGSAENIKNMVENTYTKRRHTLLKNLLQRAFV